MFTFGRKFDVTKTLCARPGTFYSTKSLIGFNQLDSISKDGQNKNSSVESFKSAIDPLQVLHSLPSNLSEFKAVSGDTVISALKTIATLQRANAESIKQQFITTHPNFELLCRSLKRCSPMFTPNELIDSLKYLNLLGVPKNSEISLTLLNLIRHEINYLNIDEIIYLVFLLDRSESSSELENAIKTALPIVFDLQIPQQIEVDSSVDKLVKVLNFMGHHGSCYIRDRNVKRICKLLGDKRLEIDLTNAIDIIHNLCAMNRFEVGNVIRLMNICIRSVHNKMNEIDIQDILKIINRLMTTTVDQHLSFQYLIHGLLKRCGERIAHEDLGLDFAVSLQTSCRNISYRNHELLKYMGDKIIRNVDCCKTMNLHSLFTIVQAFANTCYTSKVEDDTRYDSDIWSTEIIPAILQNENLSKVSPTSSVWLQFTLQLMILDHFDQELITRVLSTSYLNNYLKNRNENPLDLYKVLTLYQIAAMRPGIDVGCIDKNVLNDIFVKYADLTSKCEIQKMLSQADNNLALINVRSKYSHLIPSLVKIDKNNMFLVPFSSNLPRDEYGFVSLDDIPCSANEQLVCVDGLKRHSLFSNLSNRQFRVIKDHGKIGLFRRRGEQLRELGVTLCEINYRRFKYLADTQKIKYLHENIFLAAQEDLNNSGVPVTH